MRQRTKEAGLFTWDKPAYACLATRVPTGTAITPEALTAVEGAENALADLGYRDFRVRLFHGAAKLELTEHDFMRAAGEREAVKAALSPWFKTVLLDCNTRTGG